MTVATTLKKINATIDAFDNSMAVSDDDDSVFMILVSLRSDLIRAYDVFEHPRNFSQGSNITTTAWAAAAQTLWVYGTLAKNAALKIDPGTALKFGRLLSDLRAIVD